MVMPCSGPRHHPGFMIDNSCKLRELMQPMHAKLHQTRTKNLESIHSMNSRLSALENAIAEAETPHGRVEAMLLFAHEIHVASGDSEQSLSISKDAYRIAREADDPEGMGLALFEQGFVHVDRSEYDRAMGCALDALALTSDTVGSRARASALNLKGMIFIEIGDYAGALEHLLDAQTIAATSGDTRLITRLHNHLGIIHAHIEEYDKAIIYLQRYLDACVENGWHGGEAIALGNIAACYAEADNHQQALEYNLRALHAHKAFDMDHTVPLLNLGRLYAQIGQFDEAESSLNAVKHSQSRLSGPSVDIQIENAYALLRLEQGRAAEAIKHLQRALTLVEQLDIESHGLQTHKLLTRAYKQLGDFEKALEHFETYQSIREQIFNQQADHRVKTLHTLHDVRSARNEAEILRMRNDALENELRSHRLIEEQRIQIAVAQEHMRAMQGFINNITHDLLTPVTILHTSLDLMERITEPQRQAEHRRKMRLMVHRLHRQIQNLLLLTRLENDLLEDIVIENHLVHDILDSVRQRYSKKVRAMQRHITVGSTLHNAEIRVDRSYLEHALDNLIDNALRYTSENGTITLEAQRMKGEIRLTVRDDGHGIPEEVLDNIFNRFYRAEKHHRSDASTGLGLPISKAIIEKMNGRIQAESHEGFGSAFYIYLQDANARPQTQHRQSS